MNPLIPGRFDPKIEIYSQCYEVWHSEEVKFVNHKYDISNCGSWPEIKNLGRFGVKTVMCFNFYEIWHLVQIKHANYEYGSWNWRS